MHAIQESPKRRWVLLIASLLGAIVLPWLLVGDQLGSLTIAGAASLADRPWLVLAMVAVLLVLDPVLPVPSSVVAVAAGSTLGAGIGALAIWTGLMLGALLGFWLGRRPGRALAARMLGESALTGLRPLLRPIGPIALLLSRPVPVIAEAVVILAGAGLMPWRPFLLAVVPANAALAIAWAGLGAASSNGNLTPALVGTIVLPVLAHALWHLVRRT